MDRSSVPVIILVFELVLVVGSVLLYLVWSQHRLAMVALTAGMILGMILRVLGIRARRKERKERQQRVFD